MNVSCIILHVALCTQALLFMNYEHGHNRLSCLLGHVSETDKKIEYHGKFKTFLKYFRQNFMRSPGEMNLNSSSKS